MPQLQIFLSPDNQVSYDLSEDKVTVGRLADNTLQIEDASVSSHHAEIVLEGDKYHLHDLGSTNGTFVNGESVTDVVLKHGDEVKFGRIETIYSTETASASSQPLPQTSVTTAAAATRSARPSNFASTSPIDRTGKEKDPVATALFAFAGLAIVAGLAAAYFIFSMQATA